MLSLLRCVKLLSKLFKQTTLIPGPGFDHYSADAVQSQYKAATVFKVRYDFCVLSVVQICSEINIIFCYSMTIKDINETFHGYHLKVIMIPLTQAQTGLPRCRKVAKHLGSSDIHHSDFANNNDSCIE